MARRRTGLTALGAALLSVACHEVVRLPEPELAGAQAGLLVQIEAERPSAVYGVDLGAPATWPQLVLGPDTALYLIAYRCPLDRLGLPEGPVALSDRPAGQAFLPEPLGEVALPDGAEAWAAAAERPPVVQDILLRLPVDASTPCAARGARLEAVDAALPADGHRQPAFAVALGDGTALVAARNSFYYRVEPSGRVTPLPELVPEPRAGHALDDGTVYILDDRGRLFEGRVDGDFTRFDVTPLPDVDFGSMDGPRDPAAPLELFASTSEGRFARFDGTGWTTLNGTTSSGFFLPAVRWLGPQHAVSTAGASVVRWRSGQLTVRDLPAGGEPVAVGWSEGLGLVVGTVAGQVLVDDDGAWRRLEGAGFQRLALQLEALPAGGLLMGGIISFPRFGFAQWLPGIGACPPEELSEPVAGMTRIDDETWVLLTVTTILPSEAFDIEVLRMARPPSRCGG